MSTVCCVLLFGYIGQKEGDIVNLAEDRTLVTRTKREPILRKSAEGKSVFQSPTRITELQCADNMELNGIVDFFQNNGSGLFGHGQDHQGQGCMMMTLPHFYNDDHRRADLDTKGSLSFTALFEDMHASEGDEPSIPSWADPFCPLKKVSIRGKGEENLGGVLLASAVRDIEQNKTYRIKMDKTSKVRLVTGALLRPHLDAVCWLPYTNCNHCWHDFANATQRFSHKPEQEAQLEMLLATWMRMKDGRVAEIQPGEWDVPAQCRRPCHLQHCFSCHHHRQVRRAANEELNELTGKQTLVDRHLILTQEHCMRRREMPMDETVVLSIPKHLVITYFLHSFF